MLRVNAINRQELLKCLTFNPKSLVFKTVSVPVIPRLRVAVVVVFVDELDSAEAAQVVERLFERQPEVPSELHREDECPFHLVMITVSHNRRCLYVSAAKIRRIIESRK